MRIAVIGAGMIGVSIAAEAAARGAQVTLIDQEAPGAGTSAVSYAWVNSNNKEPESYYELNLAGLEAHHRLAASGADWLRPTGHIEFATDPEHVVELQGRLERLGELGYPADKITPSYARELVPDLLIPDSAGVAAYFPREAHCYPSLYIRHQLRRVQESGVKILSGVAVENFREAPGGVRLGLSDGSTILADKVISAAGRWTNTITAAAGLGPVMTDYQEPGDVTVGYLAVTNPLPTSIDRLLTTPSLNIRPDGGGRLLLQALDLDATATPGTELRTDPSLTHEFLCRLRGVLRNTENASITELRVGERAMPADGRSIIGAVPSASWLYLVATHSGVTLAPFLGVSVTAEIMGETEPLFADFRPDRLLDNALAVQLAAPRKPGQQ
ncbi:FAD-binding oxidoreductase [Arthrobacter sp. UYEF3]|uniref:NAD(P)/FAD-dependent oxidoreductase n=1 Tax=Arthrobacter sp. UYEF3 TaxID=1756365 RepID=UPI00339B2A09